MGKAPKLLRCWLIIGPPGSGKTTYAKGLVKSLARKSRAPVIVHDIKGEWGGLGFYALNSDDFQSLKAGDFPPRSIVVVDEAGIAFPPNCKNDNLVRRLLNQGRDAGIVTVLIVQRPRDIHGSARTFAHQIVGFKTRGEDLDWYKKVLGVDPAAIESLQDFQPIFWPKSPAQN